ncbi:hypothetical protein [Streptomyces olivaceus]|uniref:hypothetical protein n=1 Tax=Streptomyces olivaceus TaxID=47716 RepID=UPI001CCF7488|nr:hypothetical protein [Streptomyces olivaceus]MBZ6227467.1 hypothetical protein [Streptomyces olivaceus]
MDEDQAYRAMDLLVEADAQVELQEAVFFAVVNLLNVEVDLLFFDTAHTVEPRAQVPSTSAAECLEGLDRAACCPAALDPGVAGDQRNATRWFSTSTSRRGVATTLKAVRVGGSTWWVQHAVESRCCSFSPSGT